jgi:hypothetical protein
MLIADKKSLFGGFRVSHRVWEHQWIMFTHLAGRWNLVGATSHIKYDPDVLNFLSPQEFKGRERYPNFLMHSLDGKKRSYRGKSGRLRQFLLREDP